jgi:hypothetical protein
MPKFRLRRTDYGATLRDTSISAGSFTLRSSTDVTITVGTPVTTDDTQANTINSGDGKVELVK